MKINQSIFWEPLWSRYHKAPSIALCRVPELEFASKLNIDQKKTLDHCCGDGFFARLAWNQNKIFAGCDISEASIKLAQKTGIYRRLDVSDASKKLPYQTGEMDLVFNNSALEHIQDIDSALKEISRVLKTGGEFAFNVLNHRYFEWWPLNPISKKAYSEWQPFYHALSINEWSQRLSRAGLQVKSYEGYFNRELSQRFAKLDYWFSGYYNRGKPFLYVKFYLGLTSLISMMLKKQLGNFTWTTSPDGGAGYFIRAIKSK